MRVLRCDPSLTPHIHAIAGWIALNNPGPAAIINLHIGAIRIDRQPLHLGTGTLWHITSPHGDTALIEP